MTVHAVEIVCSTNQESNPPSVPKPEPLSLPNVVPDRVKQNVKPNFNPVLEGQESPASEVSGPDTTSHVQGVYRFNSNDDLTSIVESFRDNAVADAEWYEVRVHDCDHDETDRTGCPGWSVATDSNGDKISKGSVLGDV